MSITTSGSPGALSWGSRSSSGTETPFSDGKDVILHVSSAADNSSGLLIDAAHDRSSDFHQHHAHGVKVGSTPNFKAQICFDFTKGVCTRGEKCKYSHDLATIVHFNSKEKGICFDYLRNQCHRGLLCRFSHDLSNIAQQCQVYNNSTTRGKNNAICYDFVKGVCQRGNDCKYSHDLSLIARTARGANHVLRSGEVCYDYLRGRCARGTSCKYSHNISVLSSPGFLSAALSSAAENGGAEAGNNLMQMAGSGSLDESMKALSLDNIASMQNLSTQKFELTGHLGTAAQTMRPGRDASQGINGGLDAMNLRQTLGASLMPQGTMNHALDVMRNSHQAQDVVSFNNLTAGQHLSHFYNQALANNLMQVTDSRKADGDVLSSLMAQNKMRADQYNTYMATGGRPFPSLLEMVGATTALAALQNQKAMANGDASRAPSAVYSAFAEALRQGSHTASPHATNPGAFNGANATAFPGSSPAAFHGDTLPYLKQIWNK